MSYVSQNLGQQNIKEYETKDMASKAVPATVIALEKLDSSLAVTEALVEQLTVRTSSVRRSLPQIAQGRDASNKVEAAHSPLVHTMFVVAARIEEFNARLRGIIEELEV